MDYSHADHLHFLRIIQAAWIIHASRLVQTQDAASEAVWVIPRIRGSEVFGLRSAHPEGKNC